MPQFTTDGSRVFVSYITGPSHIRLGLRLVTTDTKSPMFIRQPAFDGCDHGELNEAAILAAVQQGIAEVSPTIHAAEIVYVANDSPRYDLYSLCATLLAKRFLDPPPAR